jgi:hypothetical protein
MYKMGAAVTSALFTAGKAMIGFYLGHGSNVRIWRSSVSRGFSDLDLLLVADPALRG